MKHCWTLIKMSGRSWYECRNCGQKFVHGLYTKCLVEGEKK